VRHAPAQPVTRHALVDDARGLAGSVPVRRGIAVVAVMGGALSAAGLASVVDYVPLPQDALDDAATIGLAAKGTRVAPPVDDEKAEKADAAPAVLDADALAQAVRRANEEGKRLASGDGQEQAGSEVAAPPTRQPDPARTASQFPGELIDTHDWYLTLPTGKQGRPDIVDGAQLASYHSRFFDLNDTRTGIVFTANAGGVTTSGSHYPRSELREMDGEKMANWSAASGTHTMELVEAITKTTDVKKDVIAGQIHDDKDDVMQIHLSDRRLAVKYADGKKDVVLDDDYRIGTTFSVKIEATKGHIRVWYDGAMKADLPITATNSYFKAGAYVNSNTSKGEKASAEGQVVVYRATVNHAGSPAAR
jgi:Alginate lyase